MTALLELRDVTKRFGGLVAVNGLSFTMTSGEIVGLLGPNGSGKTTALNMISGLLQPNGGAIDLLGESVGGLPANRIAHRGVARTFQLVRALPSLTVGENVLAALAFRRHPIWGEAAKPKIEELLGSVGLAGRADQPAAGLTYIDLKRMELARALAAEPLLLLLDEWLAGLNPTELRAGIDLILSLRDRGMTILLVEHVMDAVRALCDRCIVMNTGSRIAEGPTDEVLRHPEVVRAYLGDLHA
ncbi:ABC transporter ATP-binding protein [Paradevosia shaoguanensis]|uniref:ATP-binding cassette domain-containing protein n=1 Tax=Paradevosia shaoguanensis TaxID=1335043 RepID=A0AA41QNX0_9HYPH|nr:ATP-binding cassette domain-containing protein [Paradevosia shaoguanensis]MCF1742483.1 ATP-binding cassette domain-containing protein [Paradevosia shaoguanensis]MCI0126966.1 ATP-binding cassette domain-containing protein [Paradevosia shaoguanensis]